MKRQSEVTWPFAAGLLGLVMGSVLVMVVLGLALGWLAEAVA